MNSTYLPSSVQSILFSFRPCFTAPSFENFAALTLGWILARGPHTVSRAIVAARAFGWTKRRHHATFYRFLSRARWRVDDLGGVLFGLFLPFLPQRIEAVLDDTLCHRSGPQLFGGGMHHDGSRSTSGGGGGRRKVLSFGHNWVVLSIWVAYPWNKERGVAVPLLFRLYRSPKRCPEAEYRKRTELACEMLEILASWLPEDRKLDLAADSEYACCTLLRHLSPHIDFTGPMLMNAALCVPGPIPRQPMGRPRTKGLRLPSPKAMARKRSIPWQEETATLYGRQVDLLIKTWIAAWPRVLGQRPIRIVMTRDPKGRWDDRVYFSTDIDLSAQAILERYARRWSLEVTFRNVKQDLGLEDPRNGWWRRKRGSRRPPKKAGPEPRGNRGRRAAERTVPLIFMAHAFVIAWYFKHGNPNADAKRARRARPWDRKKTEPAFGDMLRALRRTIWRRYLSQHPLLGAVSTKVESLLPLMEAAA
jgi:hypothetical protein